MAKIDDLIVKIDKLVETIGKGSSTPYGYQMDEDDIKKKFELETKGMDKRTTEYKALYKEMEFQLELHRKNMLKIQEENDRKAEEAKLASEKRKEEIRKAQQKRLIDQLEDYNATELEKLEAKYIEQLEMLEDNEELKTKLTEKYEKERNEIIRKEHEKVVANFSQGWNTFKSGFQGLLDLAKKAEKEIMDSYGKADQEAVNYARAVGMNKRELESLKDSTFKYIADNDFGKLYNKSTDEIIKLMGSYNKELGRANRLSNEHLHTMAQLNVLMGETASIKFTTNLDKFGIDVDNAKGIYEDMINESSSKGLVLSEVSEKFLNNIDMAQQYTFKDGVEGLKRMTEQAVAMRWNMQQTAAFAEKVNNIEGAVKTGAQLSVLGGPFAQFSNPMGMLYESLNDMEGLQDRMMAMFGSLGSWNNETGQLDVSAYNKMRIRAAAQAMGLNYGEVMNTVHAQARRNKVLEATKNLDLDDNTRELIANTGSIDKNGQAYVTIDGKQKYIKDGLSKEDKKVLEKQANEESKNVADIAINTQSLMEAKEGVEKERHNELTAAIQDMGGGKNLHNLYDLLADIQKYMLIIQGITALIQAGQAFGKITGGISQMAANRRGMGGAMRNYFSGGSQAVAKTGGGKMTMTTPPATGSVGAKSITTTPATGSVGAKPIATTTGVYKGPKGQMVGVDGRTSAQRLTQMKGSTGAGSAGASIAGSAMGVVGLATGIGGMAMSNQADRLREKGLHDDADKVSTGGAALSGLGTGLAIGATVGSIFGPVGTLVGGAIGAIGGAIWGGISQSKRNKEEREKREAEEREAKERKEQLEYIHDKGFLLSDEYTSSELKQIRRGINGMGLGLYQKVKETDPDVAPRLPLGEFKVGGYHPSDEIVKVHSDEFTVTSKGIKAAGGEGLRVAQALNDGRVSTFNPIEVLEPLGEHLQVLANNTPNHTTYTHEGNVNSNINGVLQLNMMGHTKGIDVKSILNDPTFTTPIVKKVLTESSIINNNGGYKKEALSFNRMS